MSASPYRATEWAAPRVRRWTPERTLKLAFNLVALLAVGSLVFVMFARRTTRASRLTLADPRDARESAAASPSSGDRSVSATHGIEGTENEARAPSAPRAQVACTCAKGDPLCTCLQ